MAVIEWSRAGAICGAPLRINIPPTKGAMKVPTELNAWARFKRLDAVELGPMIVTYGLAATCTVVMPAASKISAPRKTGKLATYEAGIKPAAPAAMVINPRTIVFLYP